MVVVGIRVCHTLSSLITTATRPVSKCHPLRPCMEGNVELRYTRVRQAKGSYLGKISSEKQRNKFRSLETVMQMVNEGMWPFRKVIMCT
jgi:ABC-type enterochelin transport system ATPase subunit